MSPLTVGHSVMKTQDPAEPAGRWQVAWIVGYTAMHGMSAFTLGINTNSREFKIRLFIWSQSLTPPHALATIVKITMWRQNALIFGQPMLSIFWVEKKSIDKGRQNGKPSLAERCL